MAAHLPSIGPPDYPPHHWAASLKSAPPPPAFEDRRRAKHPSRARRWGNVPPQFAQSWQEVARPGPRGWEGYASFDPRLKSHRRSRLAWLRPQAGPYDDAMAHSRNMTVVVLGARGAQSIALRSPMGSRSASPRPRRPRTTPGSAPSRMLIMEDESVFATPRARSSRGGTSPHRVHSTLHSPVHVESYSMEDHCSCAGSNGSPQPHSARAALFREDRSSGERYPLHKLSYERSFTDYESPPEDFYESFQDVVKRIGRDMQIVQDMFSSVQAAPETVRPTSAHASSRALPSIHSASHRETKPSDNMQVLPALKAKEPTMTAESSPSVPSPEELQPRPPSKQLTGSPSPRANKQPSNSKTTRGEVEQSEQAVSDKAKWAAVRTVLDGGGRGETAEGAAAAHSAAARDEAARKLLGNHLAVLRDVTNPSASENIEGKQLTQLELRRVPVEQAPHVDGFLREVTRRLLGQRAGAEELEERLEPSVAAQASAWAQAASYLDGRIQSTAEQKPGRAVDMSPGAAAAMRAVLGEVGGSAAGWAALRELAHSTSGRE
ncbi:MAG: hypothetical protein SGPRY_013227, partial [Prymnesium sp.]